MANPEFMKKKVMTVFIIEDNEIEMENLKTLLKGFDDFEVIGTADTLFHGIEIVNGLQPDVIMLDIQLECENSLDHIGLLNYQPYIVCSTLYTEHALQAFEVGVKDYLTKPITEEKLTSALNRIPLDYQSSQLKEEEKGSFLLKNGSKFEKVPIELIVLVTADRDYTTVRDERNSEFISTHRMREWSELLPSSLFIALDRSTIVNKEQIASYTRLGMNRTAKITFINGQKHKIGPTALRRLRAEIEI